MAECPKLGCPLCTKRRKWEAKLEQSEVEFDNQREDKTHLDQVNEEVWFTGI